jgi:hypothetical protein
MSLDKLPMSYSLNRLISQENKGEIHMGSAFIIITTLKLATMGGVGIALTTAFQYFHNFDFKPNKKKGGDSDVGEDLRTKSRIIG